MTMDPTRLGASITAEIDAFDPLTPTQEAAVLGSMTGLATAVIYEIENYYSGGGGGGGISGPASSTDNAVARWNGVGGTAVQNSVLVVSDAGVVTGGTWQGVAVADAYVASASTWNAKEPPISAGTTSQYWRGDKSWQTLDKAAVGLGNVENTALSTWAGSATITTLGTIATGVWSGTALVVGKLGGGTPTAGKYLDGGGSWATLNSTAVGLGSVENAAASTLYVPLTRTVNGHALSANVTVSASDVGLGSVEDTALSTWAGTTSLTTLGTVVTGVWSGTAVGPTKGGTGATTYALGDTLYSDASNSLAKLAGNTTGTKKFLRQTGTGAVSAAPAWDTVTSTDVGLGNVENAAASGLYVPLTRTVNAKALSANITLVPSDIDAGLASLAAADGTASQRLVYTTTTDTWTSQALTAAGLALLDDADAAAQRVTLGLVIGTNVQAQDAGLTSLAAADGTASQRLVYTTTTDTWTSQALTAAGLALLDDADASAQRTTLGLVIGTNVQAQDAGLTSLAAADGTASQRLVYTTTTDTWTSQALTAAGLALLDDADAAAQRTTLGLGSVENTALSTWAGTANITTLGTIATGTWSATTIALNKGGTGQVTAAAALTALGGLNQAQVLARASFRI